MAVGAASQGSQDGAKAAKTDRPPGSFECGFGAGLVVTAALQPWDRALYLSVINRTEFLAWENWRHPYRGLAQTLVGRSMSGGLYFPFEDVFSALLGSSVLGGQAAGVFTGAVLNPISLVKYQCWGFEEPRSFKATSWRLYSDGGPRIFLRGAFPTAMRDSTFGVCFAMRKLVAEGHSDDASTKFAIGIVFAAAGTVLSSPFNYIRNLCYAQKSTLPLESLRLKYEFWCRSLAELAADVRSQESLGKGFRHLQARFRLGWGTARVAVGMALTDQIYLACQKARAREV